MRNPHFDDGLVIWSDEYSGRYEPPPRGYPDQFDLQWALSSTDAEFHDHPGASVQDAYIDDRVYEWTGVHPSGGGFGDHRGAVRVLDHPLDPDLIRGRSCIDIGCGLGRWTRTMQRIGAGNVLSIDISSSALSSVRRFNAHTRRVDILRIPDQHPDLVAAFDFANFWGVAMCTHDPLRAFLSAASTVAAGGSLYLMVYADTGMHGTPLVAVQRRQFPRQGSVDERVAYVEHVQRRSWDASYPLADNVRNVGRRLLRRPMGGKVGILDMLAPFYNWVIPLSVIEHWIARAGFANMTLLNDNDPDSCAYHVLASDKGAGAAASLGSVGDHVGRATRQSKQLRKSARDELIA